MIGREGAAAATRERGAAGARSVDRGAARTAGPDDAILAERPVLARPRVLAVGHSAANGLSSHDGPSSSQVSQTQPAAVFRCSLWWAR